MDKENKVESVQLEGLEQIDLELTIDDFITFFQQSFNSRKIHIEAIELELDDEQDRYVYEIEGWDDEYRYELKVNAKDLRIIAQEKKEHFESRDILDLANIIPPKEAMMKAIEANAGSRVEEWELEMDQGRLVYVIDFSDGEEQIVNALTGELLKEEKEVNQEDEK